jgi:hypothetical protein
MLTDFRKLNREIGILNGARVLFEKKYHTSERFIGTPCTDLAQDDCVFTLNKTPGKDFVILNITDPHFADYDIRALMAGTESATIRRLVKTVRPDLITVTGDLICSDYAAHSLKRICALFESFRIPWAPVFGNHDDESNMDLNYIADAFLRCPHCIFKKNDPAMGTGNYIINIIEENRLVESVFMMDSHHSQANDLQRAWLRRNIQKINNAAGSSCEITVMFHIPLPEYQYAYDAAWDIFPRRWKSEYKACGELHENICCEKQDGVPVQRGFFEILQNAKTVKYVFCGHEHLIDFSILYKGIRLTYTMKVGKASGGGFGLNGGTEIRIGSSGICAIFQKASSLGVIRNKEIINIKGEQK